MRVARYCAAVGMLALAACGDGSQEATPNSGGREQTLYFSNWDGEIGPDTLAEFERRTGIAVAVDEIADNVSLQTKLLTGNSGSDVVVPGSNFLQPLIAAGALQKLDRSKLPNWQRLDPVLLRALERIDPGNQYGVPYVWGTQGFAYNAKAVEHALGREPEASWRLVFDPAVAQQRQIVRADHTPECLLANLARRERRHLDRHRAGRQAFEVVEALLVDAGENRRRAGPLAGVDEDHEAARRRAVGQENPAVERRALFAEHHLHAAPVALLELDRHALHAQRLALDHPITGERLSIEAPIPDDFTAFWRRVAARDVSLGE